MTQRLADTPIPSPCTGICRIGNDGFCDGCQRTLSEIVGWLQMADSERLRLMECVLPLRGARRAT